MTKPPASPPRKKRPAKVPPPAPVPTLISSGLVPTVKVENEAESPSVSALRAVACMEYVTDANRCTLEQLHARDRYRECMSIGTLRYWCLHDKWQLKRAEFTRTWQATVETHMANALSRTRIDQMERLERISNNMIDTLESGALKAETWGEGVTGLLRIIDKMDDFREKVAPHLVSQAISGANPNAPAVIPAAARPRLTQEEAKIGARAIIQARRAAMRLAAAAQNEEKKPEDKDP